MGGLPDTDAARLEDALRRVPRIELLTHRWLGSALDAAATGACPGLDLERVDGWIHALASNPKVRSSRYHDEDVEPLLAKLALRRGKPDQALAHFNRALNARPRPDTAARQVVELASLGYFAQALAHLDEFERIPRQRLVAGKGMARVHQWVLARQDYWPRELGILRRRLNEELSASPP
jgi:tetratricopeptide (TPR) repeat protein